jgi:TPR repeat protein
VSLVHTTRPTFGQKSLLIQKIWKNVDRNDSALTLVLSHRTAHSPCDLGIFFTRIHISLAFLSLSSLPLSQISCPVPRHTPAATRAARRAVCTSALGACCVASVRGQTLVQFSHACCVCRRCGDAWYCGVGHQRKCWLEHKAICLAKVTPPPRSVCLSSLERSYISLCACSQRKEQVRHREGAEAGAGGQASADALHARGKRHWACGRAGEAVRLWRQADEQGHAEARCDLGFCYETGEAVTRDMKQAAHLYRKAAEQGHARAQCNLAVRCQQGEGGVSQDLEQAARWFHKAAEQGYTKAQFNLGVCYAEGKGVKQDIREEVRWYYKAVEQGHAMAQYNLAKMYCDGVRVKQDRKEAQRLFGLASAQGLSTATAALAHMLSADYSEERNLQKARKLRKKAREQFQALNDDGKARNQESTTTNLAIGALRCSRAGCDKTEAADPGAGAEVRRLCPPPAPTRAVPPRTAGLTQYATPLRR